MRIDMTHMPNAEKPIRIRIVISGHIQADAQRQTGLMLCPTAQIAKDNGLTSLPSATNFVTIDCGGDGDFAGKVLEQMVARAVFVRMPAVAPMSRCIRISCGAEDAMALVAKTLPEALKAARAS